MTLRLFKLQRTQRLRQLLTLTLVAFNFIFFLFSILAGSVLGGGILPIVAALWFGLLATLLCLPILRQNPIFLVIAFSSTLYFSIPITALLLLRTDYLFGVGLNHIPYTQASYHDNVAICIFVLCLFLAVIGSAILVGSVLAKTKKLTLMSGNVSTWKLALASVFIIFISAWSANNILLAALHNTRVIAPFLGNFLMDTAFMSFMMVIIALKLERQGEAGKTLSARMLAITVGLAFITLFVLTGSKGSVLNASIFLFLLPVLLLNGHGFSIPAPTFLGAVFLCALALILFGVGASVRMSFFVEGVEAGASTQSWYDLFSSLVAKVVYRLGWSGFDRYVLLLSTEINDGFLLSTRADFVSYQVKNLINLLWPGTPFKEAVAPSSQLFEQVIANQKIAWVESDHGLVRSFNTQAFTLFGSAVLYFGSFSLFFIFLFTLVLQILYSQISGMWFRLSLLYLVLLAMPAYGLETSIQLAISFFISCLIYTFVLKTQSNTGRYRVSNA